MPKPAAFSSLGKKASKLRINHRQKLIRQGFLFTLATLVLLAVLFFIGVPLLIKASILLGTLKSIDEPLISQESLAPVPPRLEPLPEATNKDSLFLQGFAERTTTIQIYQNGQKLEPVVTDNQGRFSLKVSLVEGPNRFYATASDRFDNQSKESPAQSVFFDKKPPKLEIEKPENNTQTNESVILITGLTEKDSTLTVNNRFVLVDEEGKFSISFKLEEGRNEIVTVALDRAGNQTEKKLVINYSP